VFSPLTMGPNITKLCGKFSYQSTTSEYSLRNPKANLSKVRKDIVIGKMAEWVTYWRFYRLLSDINKPDMKIYDARQKSWDSDLHNEAWEFCVKSADVQHRTIPLSWIFQYANPKSKSGGTDLHIFKHPIPNRLVVFVQIKLEKLAGKIEAIVPTTVLHEENLFSEPALAHLQGIKKAIYYSALEEKGLAEVLPKELNEWIKENSTT
jgi:hypothetical protein